MSPILEIRALWNTAPPEPRSRVSNWPTVLFSWWCTSFSAVIIITRLCGRKVRSDRLFREDYVMMASMAPLFIRMILIHWVLIYGTNNVETVNHTYSPEQLEHHSIGARLVLAARIFYAMYIWLCKLTVSEFLKRITSTGLWRRSWHLTLQGIRVFLFLTFACVVVATLTECHPFDHYWQVVPDPGPHCRQGFAQLLTMGTCDIVTDVLLIVFPIPVVLSSGQTWKRKLQMTALFSASLIMIAVTATRMPEVIMHHGRQQYRTVWASSEILASAAVSNFVILGSFLRDKGTKRNKYKTYSTSDSIENASVRRPTLATLHTVDSDEDLFRSMGVRMPDHLQDHTPVSPRPALPAPPAPPGPHSPRSIKHLSGISPSPARDSNRDSESDDDLGKQHITHPLPSPAPSTGRSISFFDVGHLLGDDARLKASERSTVVDSGAPSVAAHDFATLSSPLHFRSGSHSFLRDVGGILHPGFTHRESRERQHSAERPDRGVRSYHQDAGSAPIGVPGPRLERHDTQLSLQDAGGLLHSTLNVSPVRATEAEERQASRDPLAHHLHSVPPELLEDEDIELDEIGGLVGDERPERTAVSLREMLHRDGRSSVAATLPPPTHGVDDTFEDMIIHDAGGLMKTSGLG